MIKEKFESLIKKEKKENSKKNIENLVIFVVILIITVLVINYILKDDKKIQINSTDKLAVENTELKEDTQSDLEEKLKKILKSMEGVGDVEVLINYSETSTVVAMYNENTTESSTEENDSAGGIRTIIETDTKKEVVYSEDDGNKNPVTEKIIRPKIEGAVITAKGASNAKIKNNIIEAVKAVTGLASHKIQVFEKS